MKLYLIVFELDYEREYPNLINYLENFEHHEALCKTAWVVSSVGTAILIKDKLRKFVHYLDNIIVTEIGENTAWYLNRKESDWLKNKENLIKKDLFESLTERMRA